MSEAEAGKIVDGGFAKGVEEAPTAEEEVGQTRESTVGPKFTAVYYSHNRGPKAVLDMCLQILEISVADAGGELVAVTWEPVKFDSGLIYPRRNIIQEAPHATHKCIYEQILKGIAAAEAPVVFLCEHDVLYDPLYFDEMLAHVDPRNAAVYYNRNVWHMSAAGFFRANTKDFHFLSGCAALAPVLKDAIEAKHAECVKNGSPIHAEPLGETAPIVDLDLDTPIVDIRHGRNFTGNRDPGDQYGTGSEVVQELEPFGSFEEYKSLFAGQAVPAVPGMGKAKPQVRFRTRLASCCEEARRSPKDRRYVFVRLDSEWLQAWWVPTAQNGPNTNWFCGVFEAHNCMDCGKPLTEQTPSRVYELGYWKPLDAVLEKRAIEKQMAGAPGIKTT